MKSNSAVVGLYFFSVLIFGTALVVILEMDYFNTKMFFNTIAVGLYLVSFVFFYTVEGIYDFYWLNKIGSYSLSVKLEQWLLTPLFYGILAYLIDRFILTRFVEKTIIRILLLFIIFASMSIPVLIWHPPLADR